MVFRIRVCNCVDTFGKNWFILKDYQSIKVNCTTRSAFSEHPCDGCFRMNHKIQDFSYKLQFMQTHRHQCNFLEVYRSSHRRCYVKKDIFKTFAKLTKRFGNLLFNKVPGILLFCRTPPSDHFWVYMKKSK